MFFTTEYNLHSQGTILIINCEWRFLYAQKSKRIEFTNEETEYRSQRWILIRNIKADEIIKFIIEKMGVSKVKLHSKHCKGVVEAKALLVFMMRSLCNCKCSSICMVLGNITQARVSMLSSLGIRLIDEERYRGIVEEFMNCYAA